MFPSSGRSSSPSGSPQPNVVLITADNLGYGDLGCFGNPDVITPHLDHLSTLGARCTDFYTASPTCTVSRCSLLTGRYPQHHGMTQQLPGIEGNYGVGLSREEVILPRLLNPVGYLTACIGKWNIGFGKGSRPTERAFQEFFGHASGNMDYYTHIYAGRHDLFRGTEPVYINGYSTDLFADASCELIHRCSEEQRPFFLYLPFNAPHFAKQRNKAPGQPNLWQAPPRAFRAYGLDPATQDPKERYYAVITALDEAIGRVLHQIDEDGLTQNTVVIFFSDNGAFMIKDLGLEVASNKPLRDGGVTLWEGGIRVACMVRWPAQIPAGSICREPMMSCDLFPMIAHIAGATIPGNLVLDGRNPIDALKGTGSSPHEALFFQFRKYSAVRQDRYKLLRTSPEKPFMLFDLMKDVGETRDIRSENPQIAARMEGGFEAWRRETAAN